MEDRDKLINVLEPIKITVFEVQLSFPKPLIYISRKRAYGITEMTRGREM